MSGSIDPGFGRVPPGLAAMMKAFAARQPKRQMDPGFGKVPPGFRRPSGIGGALAAQRRGPELVSEHGRSAPVMRTVTRNLIHGPAPTPHAPVAQVGVSPINRTMPAAVLNSTAPGDVGDRQVGARRYPMQAAAPASYPQQYDVGGAQVTPQAVAHPATAPQAAYPSSYDVGGQQTGSSAMHNYGLPHEPNMLIPQLRNLIVQALAGQRPQSYPGR